MNQKRHPTAENQEVQCCTVHHATPYLNRQMKIHIIYL
ncbi:unnamed protein product [Arabidopsis halleri]